MIASLKYCRMMGVALLIAAIASGCDALGIKAENKVASAVTTGQIVANYKTLTDATNEDPPKITPPQFVEEGYADTDDACRVYFDALIMASNSVRLDKANLTAIGTAAATIMSLAKTSTKTIGITAAVFGTGAVLFDNYQQYQLLTPYPEETYGLVQSALSKFRATAPPVSKVTDFVQARMLVSHYADLCTYSGVAILAKQALNSSPVKNEAGSTPGLFTDTENAVMLASVNATLGISPTLLADDQYVYLEILAEETLAADVAKALEDKLDAGVKSKVISAKGDFTDEFKGVMSTLKTLAVQNKTFAARIATVKASIAKSAANLSTPAKDATTDAQRQAFATYNAKMKIDTPVDIAQYAYLENLTTNAPNTKIGATVRSKLSATVQAKVFDANGLTSTFRAAAPILKKLASDDSAFSKLVKDVNDAAAMGKATLDSLTPNVVLDLPSPADPVINSIPHIVAGGGRSH